MNVSLIGGRAAEEDALFERFLEQAGSRTFDEHRGLPLSGLAHAIGPATVITGTHRVTLAAQSQINVVPAARAIEFPVAVSLLEGAARWSLETEASHIEQELQDLPRLRMLPRIGLVLLVSSVGIIAAIFAHLLNLFSVITTLLLIALLVINTLGLSDVFKKREAAAHRGRQRLVRLQRYLWWMERVELIEDRELRSAARVALLEESTRIL